MLEKLKIILELMPTVSLIVYGQLIIKWRTSLMSASQLHSDDRWNRLLSYCLDPWIISAWATAFASSLAWLFVIERHPLNLAFPLYIGLIVSLVVLAGILFFGERITATRILAIMLIFIGVIIGSKT